MIKTLLLLPALALPLSAQLRITEVMSNSNHSDTAANGDWFEITNTGSIAVNIAGYSFDDDDRRAGASGSFPAYVLQPGISMMVLNDASDATFRSLWNLDPSIRVIANAEISNFPGLGSGGDEVNLFNNSGGLVDRFTFGAATEGFSFAKYNDGQPVPGDLSSNSVLGAYESDDPGEDIASPGISSNVPAPLPPFFVIPFQTSVVAGSSLSVSEYRIRSVDPNPGDTITLSLSNAPAWLNLITVSNGVGRFTGTPSTNDIGPHTFQVIATDNTNRAESQTYQIDVLPALTPIILNEYNAVGSEEYLGGGDELEADAPFDSFFSRIEGNGGAWVEFVVTQNSDIRKWTLEITNKDSTQILKLADHVALESIPAGTILTFSEGNRYLGTSFNQTSRLNIDGYAWTNIWMHDSVLIDQTNSTHPTNSPIGSDDTRFIWKNAANEIIYGPSGETIALSDSNDNGIGDEPIAVGDSEVFRLEANPSASTNPLNINYDDGSSSSYGRPNLWSNDSIVQLFNGFLSVSSPPQISAISTTKAVRGSYSAEASFFDSTHSVTGLAMPDFIEMAIDGATLTLSSSRPLTTADIGTYEVAIQIDSGAATNNLGYLVFELEVLHPSPTVVLNEYNAVEPDRYLNGGTAAADNDGAPASSDSHFGRIVGNGGNWFELAVVGDDSPGSINLTDWTIEVGKIAPSGKFVASTTIILSDAATWSSILHGTLLTFIERNSMAGGLDTKVNRVNNIDTDGYVWTNIHLGTPGFITGTNLDDIRINSSNTAFILKDSTGTVIFGPAGEGVAPLDGVGSSEIFELENDASSEVSPVDDASDTFLGYDDGSSGSTFGSPNLFAPLGSQVDQVQDFTPYIQTLTAFEVYLANLGLAGATSGDDSDGDSFSNLDEYLFGGNPVDSGITPVTLHDPTTSTISVNVRINDPIYSFVAQRSTDLQNWVSTELEIVDGDSDLGPDFTLRSIIYEGDAPKNFIRIASETAN
ncbi:MAG: lamin tail domain-containing protein [Akkermansiaceae bacterium]|nr:lamin tail domain-containing protein [Akkermansiaceae bacterium]